jgi:hypothetical protein
MSTHKLQRRVEKVENRVSPRSDSTTLVELYWSIWCRNKKRFLEMVQEDCSLLVLVPGFERAEKGMKERRPG